MFKGWIAPAALIGAVVALGGCATVVHGTTEKVQIDSSPEGADVVIDDGVHATTPTSVKLARGHPHKLVFHKPGYRDDTENLTSGTSGWILGNLVAGGFIGIAIDASNGAGRKLSSDNVNVTLTPGSSQGMTAASPPAPVEPSAKEAVAPKSAALPDYSDDEAGYAAP